MNDSADRDVAIFTEAIQLPLADRASFLVKACAGDTLLGRRVEALLQTHDEVGDFLEESPAGEVAEHRLTSPVIEKPGDRIGHCRLLEQIGEGGCGVVYLAEQEEPVRRRVALKIIKPGMDTKNVIARFEAERQALALMDHPNIARIFDAGATGSGRPYFVMQLVEGVKITDFCDRHSLSTEERLNLFIEVCQAVQHAHQKGIIHRDLKPSNIMVTRTPEGQALPVVIDFGIAKATTEHLLTKKTVLTAFEMIIGTPAYMSPEQAEMASADIDTRSDIYSLGVLLYELLTGSTPFNAVELLKDGLDEVRRVIREHVPVLPSSRLSRLSEPDSTTVAQQRRAEFPKLIRIVSGDLDWIAMKALEKDRTRRYETADSLALDIQRFLANETVSARPPSALYCFQKVVSRNKILFGGIVLVTALLLVSLAVVTTSLSREHSARLKAETEEVRSRQTTQFLKDLLQGVAPSVARGQDTTMLRGILDAAAERIGREMAGQPSVEAELRGQIGRLYLEIGNYSEAEAMHRRALAIYQNLSGPGSLPVANALHDLGLALWKMRNLNEAERMLKQALAIRRRLLGNEHAEVAASLNSLAAVYRRQQRLGEAEASIRESLEIRRKLFGNEHPEVADSLRSLCLLLGDEGKRTESEAMAREVLAMRRRLLGSEHPLVAAALVDVGWAAGYNRNPEEVELIENEALALQRKVLGDFHPDVAASLITLSHRERQRGNPLESDALLSAALSIQRKVLGPADPATLETARALGAALERLGKLPEAEAAYREAVSVWPQRLAQGDPRVFDGFEGLVRVLLARETPGEAESLLNEALTAELTANPLSSKLLILRLDLLGRRGKWKEAAADAKLLVQYLPDDHDRYHALAALLAITGDRSGWEELCRRIRIKFSATQNPFAAERMVKSCLILPHPEADLSWIGKMADVAVTPGSGEPSEPFFQVCKAAAEYRQGYFREAVEWAEKPSANADKYAVAQASAVLAMAHWRLGEENEARASLLRGEALIPRLDPADADREAGPAWLHWLYSRLFLDEAAAAVRPGFKNDAGLRRAVRN